MSAKADEPPPEAAAPGAEGAGAAAPVPAARPRAPFDYAERYTLKGVLGRGGMGTVLSARDDLLRREVAVKVLDPQLEAVPELMQSFVEEAKLTAQLEHPNIVPVHDF